MKLFVISHYEGEYEDSYQVIDGILRGPNKANYQKLNQEHNEGIAASRKQEKDAWLALPVPRKPLRYAKIQPFVDWLVEKKGFKKLPFDEWN